MKKIGLAVCYDTKNFGSQLQVLATIKKLEELGYTTEIINYKKALTPTFILQSIPRLFNMPFLQAKILSYKKRKQINEHPQLSENVSKRNKRFQQFVEKYFINISAPYVGWENLVKESAESYDTYLCGSDQLWLPHNLGSHFYTLEFAPIDKCKIAYATSFGVSQIPKSQVNKTRKYLERFQALSTREIAGQKIIRDITGRDSKIVCDPTLLFNADGWNRLIPKSKVIKEPYIFAYFLGTNVEHRHIVNEFKKQTGLLLVTCPCLDNYVESDFDFGDIQMFDMDSADFVNLIRNAEYILTDSFHASVFSILNHKKFMTFNRFGAEKNSRNSRIDSLCSLLALSQRRYQGDVTMVMDEINYGEVENKLTELRKNSVEYLEAALRMEVNQ